MKKKVQNFMYKVANDKRTEFAFIASVLLKSVCTVCIIQT